LNEVNTTFDNMDMRGEIWLLNVFASWCGPCLDEHPVIVNFAQSSEIPVLGFNYKDRPEAASQWLTRHGDPYERVVVDANGRVGLDYGVYGVPETFLIDRDGIIRYKKIGPLSQTDVSEDILPLIKDMLQ
ncbi:DsbE family thiol:disulfide interchange protein, partial [Burkholderiales bacterium]|nr:DsbE family thiol:disulfide interchange protein [Burkholderiales bacterium]